MTSRLYVRRAVWAAALVSALLVAGCGQSAPAKQSANPGQAPVTVPVAGNTAVTPAPVQGTAQQNAPGQAQDAAQPAPSAGQNAGGSHSATRGEDRKGGDAVSNPTGPALQVSLRVNQGGAASDATLDAGAPAAFTLTVQASGQAVPVTFNSGQKYDIVIEKNGTAVWRWSAGKMFTMAIVHQTIDPSSPAQFQIQWDGKDAGGRPLAPGTYTVRAVFLGQAETAAVAPAAPVTLQIR